MNNDLISREALTEEMRKSINERYPKWDKPITVADIATLIFDVIDNASTVEITEEQAINKLHETGWLIGHDKELTERPQGEWRNVVHGVIAYKACNKCNAEYPFNLTEDWILCPRCGADMTGGPE